MSQLVGVQVRDTVPFREFLQVAGGALGVHRLRAGLLCEDIGADGFSGLLCAELAEKGQGMFPGVYGPGVAVFRGVQVYAPAAGVAQISGDGDGTSGKVDVLPPQGAALAPPDAGVNQQVDQGLPFQRLPSQAGDDLLNLCWGVGQRAGFSDFIFPGFWPLHLVHWIAGYHVSQVCHFEKAVEDGVDFDHRGMSFALCLDVQEQGADLRRGDLRELDVTQGRIDLLIQVALVVGAAVLAHGDGFGGHKDPLAVLTKGEYLGGFGGGLGLPVPLLRTADYLSSVTLSLKLCGHCLKFPLNGLPAPPVRGIPATGQAGLAPASADADLIEYNTGGG